MKFHFGAFSSNLVIDKKLNYLNCALPNQKCIKQACQHVLYDSVYTENMGK